ncbi:cytosine permease [Aliiglaciecola sp. NS0011-25]|uniref:purine-cytosine permease family protein n=1 Tax=Aliiglaciecola sp. NS0011-25 TaxID=3127654 RepID=UPI00310A978D
MKPELNEFSAVRITDSQLVPWPRVAAVGAMVAFSLPTFITGLEVYQALEPIQTLLALFIGSLIIFAIGGVMGVIGAKTRMSSYLLVRIAFGDKGASIVNIAFAISLLGWFGVNINLFGDAVSRLALDVFALNIAPLTLAIIASFCMTLTTVIGFRAINWLATIMVPVLAGVTFLLAYSALSEKSFEQILATEKAATLSLGDGISAVVGAIIIGAIILPDITRFVKHWSNAIYIAFIAYVVVQMAVMGAAGLAGASSGHANILDIMIDLGLGIGASIIVIAGSWVLNSLNLYSAVLSTTATFPRLNATWVTIGLGLVGVFVALLNLLDNFITFIFYLSIIFVPVAGIIIMDYLVIRPHAYNIDSLSNNRTIAPKGFIAWLISAVFAILSTESLIPSPSGIAAIDAIFLAGIVYTTLSWNERRSNHRTQS